MAISQPYTVAVNGGLVESSNVIDLLQSELSGEDLPDGEKKGGRYS